MKDASRTQFACLTALRVSPMSGYQISENCKAWFSHFWSESYGQIYPTLRKLYLAGDIEKLPPQKGQRGNIYKITDQGEKTLVQWLQVPAVPASLRDEYYLKFFSANAIPSQIQRDHLLRKRQNVEDMLADTRQSLKHLENVPHPDADYWKLMVRAGIIAYEAELVWLDEAEAFLKKKQK